MDYKHRDCIYRVSNETCRALTVKDCKDCKFYKSDRKYYLDRDGYADIIPRGYHNNK